MPRQSHHCSSQNQSSSSTTDWSDQFYLVNNANLHSSRIHQFNHVVHYYLVACLPASIFHRPFIAVVFLFSHGSWWSLHWDSFAPAHRRPFFRIHGTRNWKIFDRIRFCDLWNQFFDDSVHVISFQTTTFFSLTNFDFPKSLMTYLQNFWTFYHNADKFRKSTCLFAPHLIIFFNSNLVHATSAYQIVNALFLFAYKIST